MRTVIAGLVVVAALALAAPAGARPIDTGVPTPSASPAPPSAAAPSGTETWIVIASSALAFVLGAGAARVTPAVLLRARTS